MFKAIKKLLHRKNKRYYEASDVLTRKEKTQLWILSSVIIVPLVIGIFVFLIG
ncbi:hypothetical protein [Acidaminobacter sp. JC074]|uniref:hypothetical protein n=1 Tax=Acidaminobacter sp. JC074 TaxID=2530199 RepID=UPI001F0DD49E|nr:hypothetical protein [Acidaminobacter sp. JC074]